MSKTALLLIDFQKEYFKGGKWPQNEIEPAVENAAKLLTSFRAKGHPVIHVRHISETKAVPIFVPDSEGIEFHSAVSPIEGELQVVKHNINSFHETNLKQILDNENIESLIIVGATSHLCIDAVTRAASDYGFQCTVVHDACATSDAEFNGKNIPADFVHASFMSALGFKYATILNTNSLLSN
jgi:nicotinamidase-related amidase